jgi:hypothetical protein
LGFKDFPTFPNSQYKYTTFFDSGQIFLKKVDFLTHFNIFISMGRTGRPKKQDKDKKVKYGISIDKYLFDKMKNEEISISKFIQNLVKEYYEKNL